eukprot:1161076-Pelagomonas_calceolata.AAC.5
MDKRLPGAKAPYIPFIPSTASSLLTSSSLAPTTAMAEQAGASQQVAPSPNFKQPHLLPQKQLLSKQRPPSTVSSRRKRSSPTFYPKCAPPTATAAMAEQVATSQQATAPQQVAPSPLALSSPTCCHHSNG